MSTRTPTETATAYLDAFRHADADAVADLVADEVVWTAPIGVVRGREDNVEGLRELFPTVTGVEVHRVVAEGGDVLAAYDLSTAGGPLPTVDWYTVRDGRLTAIRSYFDPRPLIGG